MVGNGQNPAVRDGNLMSISAEIFDSVAKTVEGRLDKRTPVLLIESIFKFIPGKHVLKFFTGFRKNKFLLVIKRIQKSKKLAFKLVTKDKNGDKKFTFGFSNLTVRGQTTARNDTVHVDMIIEFLIPGMKDLDDAGHGPKKLFIRRKLN